MEFTPVVAGTPYMMVSRSRARKDGAVLLTCTCGSKYWLSPSSQYLVNRGARAYCADCALRVVTGECAGEDFQVKMSPQGVEDAIREEAPWDRL